MSATTDLFVDDLPSDAGDGAPVVVLVHGAMDRHSTFARVRSRLMETCRVISYDRRGYAGSRGAVPPARGVDDHVSDLAEIVGDRRVTLVGHSYGGTVALAFAARQPENVGAVLAYEPPLAWKESWPSSHGPRSNPFGGVSSAEAAEAFLRRIVGPDRYDRLPLTTREEVVKDGDALVVELTAIRNDPAPFEPSDILLPVLVARGETTSEHQVEGVEWLVGELPAGSLHVIAGAGHIGHQSHPAEFANLALAAVRLSDDASAPRPPP